MAKKKEPTIGNLNSLEEIADYVFQQMLYFEFLTFKNFKTFEEAQVILNNKASYHSNVSYIALNDEDKLQVLHILWNKIQEKINDTECE